MIRLGRFDGEGYDVSYFIQINLVIPPLHDAQEMHRQEFSSVSKSVHANFVS